MRALHCLKKGLDDPLYALRHVLYGKEKAVALQIVGLTKHLAVNIEDVCEYRRIIKSEKSFYGHICEALFGGSYGEIYLKEAEYLYIILRIVKPEIVVETGVAAGMSSAFILKALKDNGMGVLYSIDLPNYELNYFPKLGIRPVAILPEGKKPGFAVPGELKKRWFLKLGKSRETLPFLLEKVGEVSTFLHDSEHTYENMMFECCAVWPYLSKKGLLMLHDVGWNSAFKDFSKKVKRKPIRLGGIEVIIK